MSGTISSLTFNPMLRKLRSVRSIVDMLSLVYIVRCREERQKHEVPSSLEAIGREALHGSSAALAPA